MIWSKRDNYCSKHVFYVGVLICRNMLHVNTMFVLYSLRNFQALQTFRLIELQLQLYTGRLIKIFFATWQHFNSLTM